MDDEDWNFQKIDENKGKHGVQRDLLLISFALLRGITEQTRSHLEFIVQ